MIKKILIFGTLLIVLMFSGCVKKANYDYDKLKTKIAEANELYLNKYVEENKEKDFKKAIDEAKTVLDNQDVTQQFIDYHVDKLSKEIYNYAKLPDKDINGDFKATYNSANSLNQTTNEGTYEGEALKRDKDKFSQVLKEAKKIYDNMDNSTVRAKKEYLVKINEAKGEFEKAIIPKIDYMYSSNKGVQITPGYDTWGSGATHEFNFTTEKYNPCIKVETVAGWGTCIAFTFASETIKDYKELRFKVKSEISTKKIKVKIPEVEKSYDIEWGQDLGGGWYQMIIPLSDFGGIHDKASQIAIFEHGPGKIYLTDIGFNK